MCWQGSISISDQWSSGGPAEDPLSPVVMRAEEFDPAQSADDKTQPCHKLGLYGSQAAISRLERRSHCPPAIQGTTKPIQLVLQRRAVPGGNVSGARNR